MLYEASAPGSLMLLGEYAVLYGRLAIVCAIDKRMTVKLSPRDDNKIVISSVLGQHVVECTQIQVVAPFQFILATLKKFQSALISGCDIQVEAEFSDKVGFGSSAAVTVATLAALSEWLGLSLSPFKLARTARSVIRAVQGQGSGADAAACVAGGIIAYSASPFSIKSLSEHSMDSLSSINDMYSYPLTVIYSGSKTPTAEAISHVHTAFKNKKRLFNSLIRAIGECAVQGSQALQQKRWEEFGKVMNIQQGLMDALGVNTPVLQHIVSTLGKYSGMLGAKISGAGLGDCVIGWGSVVTDDFLKPLGLETIPVSITNRGVVCEKK